MKQRQRTLSLLALSSAVFLSTAIAAPAFAQTAQPTDDGSSSPVLLAQSGGGNSGDGMNPGAGGADTGSATGGSTAAPSGANVNQQRPGAAGTAGRAGGFDPGIIAAALGSLGALGIGGGMVLRRRRS